ncbi:AsmA family protein [Pseudomonas aeruginosa]|uniref:AsmA family protein n=1 Tax=Pseudomonas aeruginosa TaxID=287 RepID=UPI000BB58567|nr:AsmA family protein [Pseudomonas aeruginosa]PBN00848.1 hypothetical protein B8A54_13835 [Pseudomonas aeruginosa]
MTRGRKILTWSLASLVLLLAALVVFIATFDWNLIKPTLNEKVSAALNRPFAINGNLAVAWRREEGEEGWRAWIPWPRFSAEDITLGNPEWTAGKTKASEFASLERIEFRLAPLPLLWQTIRIPQIKLTQPRAELLRLADGRANWDFDLPASDSDEPSAWQLDIREIGFDKGSVSLDDQRLKTRLEVLVDPLGKPVPFGQLAGKALATGDAANAQDYVFGWKVKGTYKGQALAGSGKVGGMLALQDASKPFPLQAEVSAGSTRAAVVGTLTDPLNLGASDLHGSLTFVARQPRPKLSGKLTSEQLRFADLGPLIGADSNAEKQKRGQTSRQPGDKVLPVEEFRTERWRDMDADVEFTGKRIVHSDQLPISDLYTHLVLNDGLLRLEPLRFGVAGGKLESDIRLDGGKQPMQSRVKMSARGFKLKQLFPGFAPMQTSFGELNGDASLSGSGNSVAKILGGADGELKMLINDGAISKGLTEIAGLNVGNYLVTKLFGDDEVKINCAAADFGLQKGLMTSRLFVFDTENALVNVDGTVNFANEKLDLDVTPHSKGLRIFSLRSPLYVRGTFAKPDAGVHAGPLVARGAGMIALGVTVGPAASLLALVAPSKSDDNQCTALLQRMRLPAKVPAGKR